MHVLIIEDRTVIAMSIEDELRDMGLKSIAIAESKAAAVASARARSPDLILADYDLPDGTGVEAVQEIGHIRPVPAIFLTSLVEELFVALPDAILIEKPFKSSALVAAVNRARNGHRAFISRL